MKVMILAAGRGERLRPLTDNIPKPLVEVAGKPVIVRLIESLASEGFRELVINLGYLGDKVRTALGDGSQYGISITYSREPGHALETGGGIFQALPLLSDPFLVVNGDIATDFPFLRVPTEFNSVAHLVLVPNPPHHPHGDFSLQGDRVGLKEQPRFTFSGIGIYRKSFFCQCKPGRFSIAPLLRAAAANGQVSGQLYRGFWSDIGTPERLQRWCELLRSQQENDNEPNQ